MSIEQKVREEVERAKWECAKAIFEDNKKVSTADAIIQALLNRFDIVEMGRVKKMGRVVEAAKAFMNHANVATVTAMKQALKDLEERLND